MRKLGQSIERHPPIISILVAEASRLNRLFNLPLWGVLLLLPRAPSSGRDAKISNADRVFLYDLRCNATKLMSEIRALHF